MRIAFVISSLGAGGAERVATILCREWVAAGHTVDLLTYHAPVNQLHFVPPPGAVHIPLDLCREARSPLHSLANTLARVRTVRRVLCNLAPDVVVTFMPETNVVVILAGLGCPWATVAAERVHPGLHPVPAPVRWARALLYRRSDCIVAQTDDIADYCRRHFGGTVAVIPNPVELVRFAHLPRRSAGTGGGTLLSVGRLSYQKGHDVTIRAFSMLAAEFPGWDLAIAGEGELSGDLLALADELGVADRVCMPGVVTDIEALLGNASIFVHAARYEGFPNALLEALAAGLPTVAADCPGAPGGLISHGRTGLLVPVDEVGRLADAMRKLMGDPSLRARLSVGASEAVRGFDAPVVAARWIKLFDYLVGAGRRRKGVVPW